MQAYLRRVPEAVDAAWFVFYLWQLALGERSLWGGPDAIHVWDPHSDKLLGSGSSSSMVKLHEDLIRELWVHVSGKPRLGFGDQSRAELRRRWHDVPLPVLAKGYEVTVPGPQGPRSFEPRRDCMSLVSNAEAVGVAVTWYTGDRRIAGFVVGSPSDKKLKLRRDTKRAPGDFDPRELPATAVGEGLIALNTLQDWMPTLAVLVHEVAHVLLGHLNGWSPWRQLGMQVANRRYVPRAVREVEATAVELLVAARRGCDPLASMRDVRLWFDFAVALRQRHFIDLLQIVAVADIITAWCAEPPRGMGVGRPRAPILDGGGGAVAT